MIEAGEVGNRHPNRLRRRRPLLEFAPSPLHPSSSPCLSTSPSCCVPIACSPSPAVSASRRHLSAPPLVASDLNYHNSMTSWVHVGEALRTNARAISVQRRGRCRHWRWGLIVHTSWDEAPQSELDTRRDYSSASGCPCSSLSSAQTT